MSEERKISVKELILSLNHYTDLLDAIEDIKESTDKMRDLLKKFKVNNFTGDVKERRAFKAFVKEFKDIDMHIKAIISFPESIE